MSKKYDHLQAPFHLWLGTKLFVYIDNVQDVETILTSTDCNQREDTYQHLQEALGVNGLFTLEG